MRLPAQESFQHSASKLHALARHGVVAECRPARMRVGDHRTKEAPRASAPPGFDAQDPRGRFTSRAAIAFLTRSGGVDRFETDSDSGVATDVIADALGREALDGDPELGEPLAVDGSYGRGAESWVPVIQWTAEVIIGGALGNAAWAGLVAAAKQLRRVIDGATTAEVQLLVSRGAAAFVAMDHIVSEGYESGIVDVEAVEEPSTLAGGTASEISYVGFEPWLVSLLNEHRTVRYLVAISPAGQVLGMMQIPMSELESMFVFPPRPE